MCVCVVRLIFGLPFQWENFDHFFLNGLLITVRVPNVIFSLLIKIKPLLVLQIAICVAVKCSNFSPGDFALSYVSNQCCVLFNGLHSF